ncbi:MAG TPA: DUF6777 domain-containing protein, partial [Mycobacteriales bacterium]|nr:DUF6777 domain-containing protein [Mycobacteriales bacterium]
MSEFWVGPADAPDTYQLVSLLGSGGEGEVWKAILPLSAEGRRFVAVKITPGRPAGADTEQFSHLVQSLSHPGLVRVTHVFGGPARHRKGERSTGNVPVAQFEYVVMDYIDGINLREWVAEHPDTPVSERLRLLGMVAAALDDMHSGAMTEVALAHGDVKPANIVVRADGSAILVDLGLTRLTDAADEISGHSAAYAAPELRIPGGRSTPASDRYAFALTTAHLLTGQPPPVGPGGWLDQDALSAQLKSTALTARRHQLAQAVMDVLAAPAEARNCPLRSWLDSTIDSLSQITESAPSSAWRPVTAAGRSTSVAPSDAARAPSPGSLHASAPPQGLWQRAATSTQSPLKRYLNPFRAKCHQAPIKERGTMHPTDSDNAELDTATNRRRRKPFYVIATLLVVTLAAGAWIIIPKAAPSPRSEIFAAPADSPGDNPFARGLSLPQTPSIETVNTPPTSSGATPSVAADTPGVYARVQSAPTYDTTKLASQIQDDPQKTTAFSSGAKAQPGTINSFLSGLQAMYLTSTIRVTYYTYVNGSLVALQAVLQPTTLVLVDKFGNPVVRVVGG